MSILIIEKNIEEHQMKKKIYSLALICIMMITVIPTEMMAKTKKNDYWPEGPQVRAQYDFYHYLQDNLPTII